MQKSLMRNIWGAGSIIVATIGFRLMFLPGFADRSRLILATVAIAVLISFATGAVGVTRGAASAILAILGLLMSAFMLLAFYVNAWR